MNLACLWYAHQPRITVRDSANPWTLRPDIDGNRPAIDRLERGTGADLGETGKYRTANPNPTFLRSIADYN